MRNASNNVFPLVREFIKFVRYSGVQINWCKSQCIQITPYTTSRLSFGVVGWFGMLPRNKHMLGGYRKSGMCKLWDCDTQNGGKGIAVRGFPTISGCKGSGHKNGSLTEIIPSLRQYNRCATKFLFQTYTLDSYRINIWAGKQPRQSWNTPTVPYSRGILHLRPRTQPLCGTGWLGI